MTQTRDLTEGSPVKKIFLFFVPVLLGNLFQQFYNLADTAIVGRFVGKEALAAVGSTGSLCFLVLGFAMGLCSGVCIPVAQAYGARDLKLVRTYIANIIYLCAVICVILTVLTMVFTGPILRLINTPEEIFRYAEDYVRIMFAGISVLMLYNTLANISRAVGDSRTPLIFLVLASFLNIGLDLWFVLGFGWGTGGAAFATVLSQFISALCCFVYMLKKFPELRLSRGEMKPDMSALMHLLHMGIPMALQFSITAVGSVVLQSTVNPYGSDVVATVAAANKVQFPLTQPMEAMGATMATYVSQNLGAGRYDRIVEGVKKSLIISVLFCALSFSIGGLFGSKIGLLFIAGTEIKILAGIRQYLLTVGMFLPMLAALLILRNVVQGLGYAVPATAAGLFELVARALVGILFVRPFGFDAICFANPAAWCAAVLLLAPVYLYVIKIIRARLALRQPEAATAAE